MKKEISLTYKGVEIDFKKCKNGKWIIAIDRDVELCESEFESFNDALEMAIDLIENMLEGI